MAQAKELSTQVVCEEEWEVNVGKKTFTLNPKQVNVLKEATKAGARGIVWFDDFGISIPHINYITRSSRRYFKFEPENPQRKLQIDRDEYESLSKELIKQT